MLLAQKKTKKELLNHLGLTDTNFTGWKYGKVKSYMKYITQIADYLGTSTNYLLCGNDLEQQAMDVTENERKLIQYYRSLTSSAQYKLIDFITSLSE